MANSLSRNLGSLFLLAVVAVTAYAYRGTIMEAVRLFEKPCSSPVPYTIGAFDAQFGIGKQAFASDIQTAADIWNAAAGRKLFAYDPSGGSDDLSINLIYDYRQQATQAQSSLGTVIDDDTATYDSLKARYESLKSSYAARKSTIDAETSSYESALASHASSVEYWNSHGGASRSQYAELQAEKQSLDAERAALNQHIDQLNQDARAIDALAASLNTLGSKVNQNIDQYNSVGSAVGTEFDEGIYVQNGSDRHIDVYEFSDENRLIRVLTHELGHALGLDHVDDPSAIMYKRNESTNEKPTAADLAELKAVCRLK